MDTDGHRWAGAMWSAVTCHRFDRLAGLPARKARVQRAVDNPTLALRGGDKSPAESGESRPSKALCCDLSALKAPASRVPPFDSRPFQTDQ
jgi:hypothetical protein